MRIKRIEQLEEGLIIYTNRPVHNTERASIINNLKQIAAETLGLIFFRVEA